MNVGASTEGHPRIGAWARCFVAMVLGAAFLAGVLIFPVDRWTLALVDWIRGAGAGGAAVFAAGVRGRHRGPAPRGRS
jgi:hypothetical protein